MANFPIGTIGTLCFLRRQWVLLPLPELSRHISSIDLVDRLWSTSWYEISLVINLDHFEGLFDNILPLLWRFDLGYFKLLRKRVRLRRAWCLLRWWASHIKPLSRGALLLTLHRCVVLYDCPQSRLITCQFEASLLVVSASTLVKIVAGVVGDWTQLLEASIWILGAPLALSQGLVGDYVIIDQLTPVHDARRTVKGIAVYVAWVILDIVYCIPWPFHSVVGAVNAEILIFSRILSVFITEGVVNFT